MSAAPAGARPETEQAPTCIRCRNRHDPALKCWGGRYSTALTVLVLATYGTVCCHLGAKGCPGPDVPANTAEHIRPRSRYGADTLDNLRPAHFGCNSRRGDKPMTGWTDRPTASRPW